MSFPTESKTLSTPFPFVISIIKVKKAAFLCPVLKTFVAPILPEPISLMLPNLKSLDIKFAWIVNSDDGLDEISPYAKTNVMQLKDNEITEITIDPKKLKINADKFENLLGQDAKFNAGKMLDIFKGEDNDFSKAVCLNAAAGLIVSEKYENYEQAYNYARDFIKSGASYKHLVKIQNA